LTTCVNSKRFRQVADSRKTKQIYPITVRRMCFDNSKDRVKVYETKIFMKFKSVNRNIVTRQSEDIVTEERTHLTTRIWKLKTT